MNDRQDHNHDGFGMPEGYFPESASRLKHRLECAGELRHFPRLGVLRRRNPFFVPAGYFEGNADIMANRCRRDTGPGFTMPQDFFLSQESDLRHRLAQPPWAGSPGPGFVFPQNYFENSARTIRGRLTSQGKVVRLSFRRGLYFAAAAVLLVVAGLWLYSAVVLRPVEEDCITVACLEKNDVLRSGALENLSEEELMLIIDGDDLEAELMLQDLQMDVLPGDSNAKGGAHS